MATPFAPYDPGPTRRRRNRGPRFRKVPLRLILPNVVTILALCAGLTAIRMALEGRFESAIFLTVLAAFLDSLDGRIARFLRGTSRFGAELDSLADFVNFGVAPTIILYEWTLHEIGAFGWTVALIFAISMALRLARFNVASDDQDNAEWMQHFFSGVPAPSGALIVMLPLYLQFAGMPVPLQVPVLIAIYVLFVAALTVSRLPTYSGKKFASRIRRDLVLPAFILVVTAVAMLVSFPFEILAVLSGAYLCSIPFASRTARKMKKVAPPPEIKPGDQATPDP